MSRFNPDHQVEPIYQLRAFLEGEGFEDKQGRWTKDVDLAEMKSAVLAFHQTLSRGA